MRQWTLSDGTVVDEADMHSADGLELTQDQGMEFMALFMQYPEGTACAGFLTQGKA